MAGGDWRLPRGQEISPLLIELIFPIADATALDSVRHRQLLRGWAVSGAFIYLNSEKMARARKRNRAPKPTDRLYPLARASVMFARLYPHPVLSYRGIWKFSRLRRDIRAAPHGPKLMGRLLARISTAAANSANSNICQAQYGSARRNPLLWCMRSPNNVRAEAAVTEVREPACP